MPRTDVLPHAQVLPRVVVLAFFALGTAGCSNSGGLDIRNPFGSSKPTAQASDVTGSVQKHAAPAKLEAQPLPAPSAPQTVAAQGTSQGVAQGAQGLGAYRPAHDVTGSVTPPRPAAPVGHWSWEGGTPVTVAQGDTVEIIGRRYGVPVAAIMQANNITDQSAVKPGQRLVIPRYVSASAQVQQIAPQQLPPAPVAHAPATQPAAPRVAQAQPPQHVAPPPPQHRQVAQAAPAPQQQPLVHVVQPGESLMGIARKNGVSLKELAKANKLEQYTKVNMGDRLTIPGKHAPVQQANAAPKAEPQKVAAKSAPAQVANAAPQTTQSARVATPEPASQESSTKTAEPAGAIPSFRWPVRGRIIVGFGPRPNGPQNDGINLAVPEGTPIKAADDGVVAYAGNELKGYGNLVLIRHSNGYVSAYAHASELTVKRGDTIKRGQTIARAGQTGNVTSPQLHFEIRKGSTPVDPTQFLGSPNG